MKRLLPFLLCSTIVAAIAGPAAADAPSEEVPVPGGIEAFAAALGVEPVPDRARFIAELARLLHGVPDRRIVSPDVLLRRLRQAAAAGAAGPTSRDLVPLPLATSVWNDAVFHRRVAPADVLVAVLSDRQAALLGHGLAGLDDDTLQYLADHAGVVARIYTEHAAAFAVFGASLRVHGGRVVPPGGDAATPLWEAVMGERVTQPERFIRALFGQAEGRTAYLYDTIAQLDSPRAAFALGLWMTEPGARLAGMQALAAAWIASLHDWRVGTQPFARQPYDLASLLRRIGVDAAGRPAPPASRALWSRVFEGAELPDDPAEVKLAAADRPFDAAWLAASAAAGDARVRAERLDQVAFGQRVFAGATAAETGDVFVALRAFHRYRMLMLTLERLGARTPALYAAAARQAARLSPHDPARAFVSTAQLQGALALLLRMTLVGTIDQTTAARLASRLVAVPLNADSLYAGGIVGWLADDLRPVMPSEDAMEASILAALSGPEVAASAPRVEWESRTYRVDLAVAERRRMGLVRERQGSLSIDVALELAAAARTLASIALTLDDLRAVTTRLRAAADELPSHGPGAARADDGLPPGMAAPPDPRDTLLRAVDELAKISSARDVPRAGRIAAIVVEAADEAAAQALMSLVYAMEIGDPEGPALLVGDISRRHDFGFTARDSDVRLRTAWMLPRPDVAPGVPWHVDGSLLGLDVGLAAQALRRTSTDRALQAPALSANERETFAVSVALVNPFALDDAGRDRVVAAIERGRRRVAALTSAAEVDEVADEIASDGWRRRAMRWTLVHEPGRLESFFSLGELLALGGGGGTEVDAWGTAALVSAGCLCTRMPPPGQLPLLAGRLQLGLLATAMPDLNLQIARMLAQLGLPARLAKYLLSAAVQDYIDEVRPTDAGDWLTLIRTARTFSRERVEDYVAAATADGPLVLDSRDAPPRSDR